MVSEHTLIKGTEASVSFDFSFLSILSVRTNHRITVLTCRKVREKLQLYLDTRARAILFCVRALFIHLIDECI